MIGIDSLKPTVKIGTRILGYTTAIGWSNNFRMGFEARKTNRLRTAAFIKQYFSGTVLDIGCGPDLVVPHAMPFDLADGDAGQILSYLPRESFDCVHSSHCLEHMQNVPSALRQWWALVKPGGFMIIVVPEENLYEQGYWPSFFNDDHKATFRLNRPTTWSPISYDLRELLEALPDCDILDAQIQDAGYDYTRLRIVAGRRGAFLRQLQRTRRFLFRVTRFIIFRLLRVGRTRYEPLLLRLEDFLGKPASQTDGDAVAQIQAVVQKRSSYSPFG